MKLEFETSSSQKAINLIQYAEELGFHGHSTTAVDKIIEREIERGHTTEAANAEPAVLDAAGLPHDLRIHAVSKNQTQLGVWSKKSKVPAEVFAQVVAELRVTYPDPLIAEQPTAQPIAATIDVYDSETLADVINDGINRGVFQPAEIAQLYIDAGVDTANLFTTPGLVQQAQEYFQTKIDTFGIPQAVPGVPGLE